MKKIKRFFECLLPETICNLKCSYCYVIQRENRKMKMANLKYTPEQIGEALTQERLGGVCYFSICGAGETTVQPELEDIVWNILKQGHVVNITTNGTLTNRIKSILERNKEFATYLNFSFSLHYIELKNKKLLDTFFSNINLVKRYGCSFVVQINLCDEYLPYLDEIMEICVEKTGAKPQVAATRKEENLQKIELLTNLSNEEYIREGQKFESPLFDFTMKNFNVKRKEFCYAGDWTATLNLATGIMRRCYCSYFYQDIFKNPKEKINFLAIGNKCGSPFCMNSSHFMTLGVIPELDTPTYAELRNRSDGGWYSEEMNNFLSGKLKDSNTEYSTSKKILCNGISEIDAIIRKVYKFLKKKKG